MDEKLKMIKNKTQYDEIFDTKEKREEALKIALDIRKFEIDLYWKRAAYFWTFIAAAFGAYFLMYKAELKNGSDILIIIACLGFVFSLAWYLANRGSKFWSGNWELHVDYLEDEKIGPLYKTVTAKENFKIWDWLRAYPFSVAKINQVLNLYVLSIWLFLIIFSFSNLLNLTEPFKLFNESIICFITIAAIFAMFFLSKTDFEIRHSFHFVQRQLPNDDEPNQANQPTQKAARLISNVRFQLRRTNMAEFVYVDNSNVFIEGKRVAAVEQGMAMDILEAMNHGIIDNSYRIDFGKLHSFVAGNDPSKIRRAVLFGSRPPQNDSLWNIAKSVGFEVIVEDRNVKNKEKKLIQL